MEDILTCQDPLDFDWISIEDPDRRYVKEEFAAHMPPSIPKAEAHASNESAMSEYCRFAQVILSLSHVEGFDADFDLGVKQGDSNQSNGQCKQFVLYTDSASWHQLMTTKDL